MLAEHAEQHTMEHAEQHTMEHAEQHTMEHVPREQLVDETRTITHAAYVGVPLGDLSSKARGDVLEGVVRRVLEQRAGKAATDAAAGATVAGRKRGRNSAPYDFALSGRRVEVKSAQLAWNTHKRYWEAVWQNIKPDAHDDLYLALYTPSGVYIHLHNGVHGVSTQGKEQAANGGRVIACGPRFEPCIARATAVVCDKLASMLVAHVPREQLGRGEERGSSAPRSPDKVPPSGATGR